MMNKMEKTIVLILEGVLKTIKIDKYIKWILKNVLEI